MKDKQRIYMCIDLKTFFASVECVERKLDPFKTDLVVADPSRGNGAICLAISPKMKSRGIKNRCRFFEIPKNVKPIVAKPRMKKYIEYSCKVYSVYLKWFSPEDIIIYSIDECFIEVTDYLSLYEMRALELAKKVIEDVLNTTGITAAAGLGTNLYLAKIAMDITAKHSKNNIGCLTEELYKKQLWHHTPLTDFWQCGRGIKERLNKLGLKDMFDVAHCEETILFKEFGINARLLIDHSKGIEPCTIAEIKAYKPKTNSISNSQILFEDYSYKDARKVLTEMIDSMTLRIVDMKLITNYVGVYIGYSKDKISPTKITKKLEQGTNSYTKILEVVLKEYDKKINRDYKIRRIGLTFGGVEVRKYEQFDIFGSHKIEEKDEKLEIAINDIKKKYGKNSILRGISYEEKATQKKRNTLIGGHNAE